MEHYKNKSLEDIVEVIDGVLVTEMWKDIIGYEGLYMVSNFGRVKSLERIVNRNGAKNNVTFKSIILSYKINKMGYLSVGLSNSLGGRNAFRVNRLVASHFISNHNNKKEVNHKDCKKTNNFYLNLEWATREENMNHAVSNNRLQRRVGSMNNKSIIVLDTQTGIFYESIRLACIAKNLKYKNVVRYLDGTFKENKTSLIYA
jgi:hypothetical protein